MESIKLNCTFEERTSKEGKVYKCVVIKLSENYEKIIFLNAPEIALLENSHK